MPDSLTRDIQAVNAIDVVPKILQAACRVTGLGFSAIARVTDERWIACAVLDQNGFGLKAGDELDVQQTFCRTIRETGRLVAFDDAHRDPEYRDHPLPRQYGIRSYLSVPISFPDGRFFGTLCAISAEPGRVKSEGVIETFSLFANLVALHLDARERLDRTEQALREERQLGRLREQFVAILGHDLRNPLAAIHSNASVLTLERNERPARAGRAIVRSVGRMTQLIDNLLDFARARLGGGIGVERASDTDLAPLLHQVIGEARSSHPERQIVASIDVAHPLNLDGPRIAQMLSNLLANALHHGRADGPVEIQAEVRGDVLELSVVNRGEPIPLQQRQRLFEPFTRAGDRSVQDGLGLGLFIAAEIVRGHGGTIDVQSSGDTTRFVCRIPLAA